MFHNNNKKLYHLQFLFDGSTSKLGQKKDRSMTIRIVTAVAHCSLIFDGSIYHAQGFIGCPPLCQNVSVLSAINVLSCLVISPCLKPDGSNSQLPCEKSLLRPSQITREEEVVASTFSELLLIQRSSFDLSVIFFIFAHDRSPHVINIFLNLQQRGNC